MTLAMAILLAYPLYAWASPEVLKAVSAAGIIALVNVIVGAAIIEYAIDKPNMVFLGTTIGGMGVRMLFILIAVAVLIGNGYDQMALTFALMGFYLIFMIAEFIYITREFTRRKTRVRAPSSIANSRSYVKRKSHDRTTDPRLASSRPLSPRIASADHRSN